MNTTRKIERHSTGVLIAALTPEEAAKWDELQAAKEKVEVALRDARRDARVALGEVRFFAQYREALCAQIRPLHRLKFPELYQK
jgi:hypothetical protein